MATTPRVVNAQRMGAKLHLCVADVRGIQKCACGADVVQSDDISLTRWNDGTWKDGRHYDLTEADFCRRGCWPAYQAAIAA